MGGCTSKDKTVAENEGCVKYIFSSSFFSSLPLLPLSTTMTHKSGNERERKRAWWIFCFCAGELFHSPLLKYFFFIIFPPDFPIFPKKTILFVCEYSRTSSFILDLLSSSLWPSSSLSYDDKRLFRVHYLCNKQIP